MLFCGNVLDLITVQKLGNHIGTQGIHSHDLKLYNHLCSGLNDLEEERFSEEAQRLTDNAVSSQREADEAIGKISRVEDQLATSATEAREVLKNVADGNRDINRAREQGEWEEDWVTELKVKQDIHIFI